MEFRKNHQVNIPNMVFGKEGVKLMGKMKLKRGEE
jgi:hypothetical protein